MERFRHIVFKILRYFVASLCLAVIYYFIISCFVSTDVERALRKDNRAFDKEYASMVEKLQLVSDEVDALQLRNSGIYRDIFKSEAPELAKLSTMDFLNSADTIPDKNIVKYTGVRVGKAMDAASRVEANFREIFEKVSEDGFCMPPMGVPVKDFSYVMTGAGPGMKVSPFYNVPTSHRGLDILSPSGSEVLAAADGLVTEVRHSHKGLGNVVVISHPGGYKTLYAHLSVIKAQKGKAIKAGDSVGRVGMTGNTYAPHLHYEVRKDTLVLNPVNFLFHDITPSEYANVMYMSVNTAKSMD